MPELPDVYRVIVVPEWKRSLAYENWLFHFYELHLISHDSTSFHGFGRAGRAGFWLCLSEFDFTKSSIPLLRFSIGDFLGDF